MAKKFRVELKRLEKSVYAMGLDAAGMLRESIVALKKKDSALARKIVGMDDEIAEMDDRIEDDTLKLIALYQPMAGDMRTVASSLKMITYITRVGKYAKDIAMHVIDLNGEKQPEDIGNLLQMEKLVSAMIKDALEAYRTRDATKLAGFSKRDDKVDALYETLFLECERALTDGCLPPRCHINYVMIARYLERCGDHACKMAEKVHYMVTGERISIQ